MKFFFTTLLAMAVLSSTAQIRCIVKGRTINRPQSTTLLLSKPSEDLRNGKRIPITDSAFEFVIEGSHPEIYNLTFYDELQNGSMRLITFCTSEGGVTLELHPMDDYRKNSVIGGDENIKIVKSERFALECYDSLHSHISDQINEKYRAGEFYSEIGKAIDDSMRTATSAQLDKLYRKRDSLEKSGMLYTPQTAKLMRQADSASIISQRLDNEYRLANISLHGYSLLIRNLSAFTSFAKHQFKGEGSPLDYLEGQSKIYEVAYPGHPYVELSRNLIANLRQVAVRGQYIDFEAPDLNGRMVRLSEQIKGKIALIDLWASWCGPCRRNSISFKPIYDEYKDRGFTIVGVAREKGSDEAMRKAIEQDGYQWINLLELDDKAQIWLKYGIVNAAGGTYLVDRDGTILATDPTAAEVNTILKQKIK